MFHNDSKILNCNYLFHLLSDNLLCRLPLTRADLDESAGGGGGRYYPDRLSERDILAFSKFYQALHQELSISLRKGSTSPKDIALCKKYLELVLSIDMKSDPKESALWCKKAFLAFAIKHAVRFFQDNEGNFIKDDKSYKWTLSFYKFEMAQETLTKILENSVNLDPFGGSGYSCAILATLVDNCRFELSDLGYFGGTFIDSSCFANYAPDLNVAYLESKFSLLPSWARPNLQDHIGGFRKQDAARLPYEKEMFDFVVSEIPFGKNCPIGAPLEGDFLKNIIKEGLRVTKKGLVLAIPETLTSNLEEVCISLNANLSRLTENLSDHGKLAIIYVHVWSKL